MKQGFTIVETIFVLVILIILASVAYEKVTGKVLITEEMVSTQHQEVNATTTK